MTTICEHIGSTVPGSCITETGFCFECWQREHTRKRAARVTELRSALARGCAVYQAGTIWTTAGVIHTRYGVRADAVFIEPYQSDPAYLAEHLENREHGFGLLTIICTTKG